MNQTFPSKTFQLPSIKKSDHFFSTKAVFWKRIVGTGDYWFTCDFQFSLSCRHRGAQARVGEVLEQSDRRDQVPAEGLTRTSPSSEEPGTGGHLSPLPRSLQAFGCGGRAGPARLLLRTPVGSGRKRHLQNPL